MPVWNYAKVPRVSLSPEENARLLCVYMRPWTLNPADATEQTPLLEDLSLVAAKEQTILTKASALESHNSFTTGPAQKHAQDEKSTIAEDTEKTKRTDSAEKDTQQGTTQRTPNKACAQNNSNAKIRSYAAAWMQYIDGNVVTEMNKRFITNLLTATAARVVEEPGDSSADSDDFEYNHLGRPAGSMELIKKTLNGISAKSEDDGAEGIGRHAAVIRLGRAIWQSDPLTDSETAATKETFFDNDAFPPAAEVLNAAAEAIRNEEERPAPYNSQTESFTSYSKVDYAKLLRDWFAQLRTEKEQPNTEQLAVLHAVRDRILEEKTLETEGPGIRQRLMGPATVDLREEPFRGLCHGLPGTGKSRVIKWLIRMFTEAMHWSHGTEFQCVAFQNTVAFAMGGLTLHASGDIQVGGTSEAKKLDHNEIDILFTRNQALRWLLFDEVFMIADDLLGTFADRLTDAAQSSRYAKRNDDTKRMFGGYNFLMFGDMNQLPPIPASAALFRPPLEKKTETARQALNIFWSDGPDSLNFFQELTAQMRIDDEWYNACLAECREGSLSEEMYNFLMGFPTEHAGSWLPASKDKKERLLCERPACQSLPSQWKSMAITGETWQAMQAEECDVCKEQRARRNRLIDAKDTRIHEEPFLSAPYVHQNNTPKYHAMLLRAQEEESVFQSSNETSQLLQPVHVETKQNSNGSASSESGIEIRKPNFE